MSTAMRTTLLAATMTSTLALSGCYRVTITSARPESPSEIPALNGANHGGYVNGIAEDGELRLQHLCKGGWATIHIETGFLSSLTNWLYGLIYWQQNVTVKCAPEGAAAPAPPAAAPPPSALPPPTQL